MISLSKKTSLEIRLSGEGHAFFDLVDKGKSATIADGISIRYDVSFAADSADIAPVHYFVITVALPTATTVAATLIAEYLLRKLQGKGEHLTISKTEVELEKGQITRIISEEIEKSY
jgi:hypothetical protein